jgi:hypothetical protein
MGGQTSVWGQNVFDPLGAAIERKTFGANREAAKNRKKKVYTPSPAQLMLEQMQSQRELEQENASKTKLFLSQQADALRQPTQAVPQILQDIKQPELKPATQVQPNLTTAIPTPVAATAAIAPLANQSTGMAQQKVNQFAMPNASGLKFGGV